MKKLNKQKNPKSKQTKKLALETHPFIILPVLAATPNPHWAQSFGWYLKYTTHKVKYMLMASLILYFSKIQLRFKSSGASLVAQWLRICLPVQGTQVQALVWEDPTGRGATKPVRHNY